MADDLAPAAPNDMAEAQDARDVAARRLARHDRPDAFTPAIAQPDTSEPIDDNLLPSDQHQIDTGDVDLHERARLNFVNSYYRGTLAGSLNLAAGSHFVTTPDDEGISPEMKRARNSARKEYHQVVADLARYDAIRPWGSTVEAVSALGGTLAGGMLSPESFLGVGARGATWLGRTVKAAFQQGSIQAAVDPVVQWLSNDAGVAEHKGWDPMRTGIAFGTGAIIGGGMHGIGELISSAGVKKIRADLAKEDPQMRGAVEASIPEGEKIPEQLPSERGATVPVAEGAAAAPAAEPATIQTSRPQVEGVKHEESGVAAELPTTTPVQKEVMGETQALAARAGGGDLPMERARPDTGVPSQTTTTGTALATVPGTASPQQESAIRSLQQQAMDLSDAIGFPLRQGRVKGGALGTFNTSSGVVRVKEVPDFEVVAHEAGHAIETKIGTDLTDLTNQFGTELAPLVSNAAAYDPAVHVKEGFAEYVRRYIGNPAHAQQVAPGFSIAFRNFMEQRAPEMMKAIDEAAAGYKAYLDAPSVDVVGAVRRTQAENEKGWSAIRSRVAEEGFPAVVKSVVQKSYTAIFDHNAPVARVVRELSSAAKDASGNLIDLKAADNPEVLLRLFSRSQQAALHDMMDGVRPYHSTTPDGPSMTEALAKAMGQPSTFGKWDEVKRADFSTYLIARRAAVLWEKFERGDLPRPPAAFGKGDAATAMADMERLNPTFREASDMVHDYTRQVLRKMNEGGLIDRELHGKLAAEPFYVPFMRDMSDKPMASTGLGSSSEGPGMAQVVKKMQGSSRDIIDPVESIMMQSFLVNRTIQHNDIIRSFVRLAEKAGPEGGRYVEKIPAQEAKKYTFDLGAAIERKAKEGGMSPEDARFFSGALSDLTGEDPLIGSYFKMEPAAKRGEPIVFYKENGELRVARFMSEKEGHGIYELLTSLPQNHTDLFSELVATTSSILRTGIITNPSFAVTNYIRDQVAASILRRGYVPMVSGIKGIAAEFKQTEAAKLYGYGGGVAPGASIAPIERAVEADVNALAKKGYLVNRVTSFKGLLDLASFTEAGTRNSVFADVFKAKRAQGLNDYEAMIEAAFQSTDLLDFSRHGSRTEWVRKYIPFLNAHFQGMDKAYRTMVQPIVDRIRGDQVFASDPQNLNNAIAAWVKAGGIGMVLGVGWAAINSDSEAYRDASPVMKGTHVVVPFGNKIFLWPKPFELGIGFTAGEYAYQKWMQEDPRAASQFAHAAWQALEPPNPLGDIPALKQYFELKANKSLFTGNDIVPDRLQRLPAWQQYTDRTSSLAKQLGKVINVSPIKIDYAIGSTFGNWGRDIMTLSSGVDESAPAQNWEDYVFLRRLIKDPTKTSDVTTKFWGFMAQTTGTYNQNVNGYDNLVRTGKDAEAMDFLQKLPARERAFVTMKSAADESGKPAFKTDDKRLHPLQRAYDAVTILNGLRRDLVDNNVSRWEDKAELKMDPATRRDMIENVRELAQMEMRNAFVIMKEPGYAGRPILNTDAVMDKIRKISPQVGEEIATRYATAKIYTTNAVANAYPELERALNRDGSEAELNMLSDIAKDDGYAFGGERTKRPPKRRMQIAPQSALQ